MIYPFSTGHQARCSSIQRSSHVLLSSISFAISVVSMVWSSEHCAFVVETYFKCREFVIAPISYSFWRRPARKNVKQKKHIVVETQFLTDLFSIKTETSWQTLQCTDTRDMLLPHLHNIPLLNMPSPWGYEYLTIVCGEFYIWI